MKLEKNMYVRNTFGRIAKIEEIEDDTAFCDNWLWQNYECLIDFINLKDEEDVEDIIKASFNITDLIEVGDYVNGYEVVEEPSNDNFSVGQKHLWLCNKKLYLLEQDIESIVTHQQFEKISYKVGE